MTEYKALCHEEEGLGNDRPYHCLGTETAPGRRPKSPVAADLVDAIRWKHFARSVVMKFSDLPREWQDFLADMPDDEAKVNHTIDYLIVKYPLV